MSKFEELKTMFWHIEAEENGVDNIAVALTTYFESLPDTSSEDIDDETGWPKDAMRLFNNLDSRINNHFKEMRNAVIDEAVKVIEKNTFPDGMIDMYADDVIKEIKELKE